MGNEVQSLRKDLIDLDIEEMKINRELYNLQLQINAKLAVDKKLKIKNNYKKIAERKLYELEQKKDLLLGKDKNIIISENTNNNNTNNQKKNQMICNVAETEEVNNGENNNNKENKLSLISNS